MRVAGLERHHAGVLLLEAEAARYCALIEEEDLCGASLTTALIAALVDLLRAGYDLPEVEPDTTGLLSRPSHDEWREMFRRVGRRLDAGYYWTVPALPFDYDTPEPDIGDLGDDLADIWRDLVTGLRAREDGATANDILWQWKLDFESHWGAHAVDALRLLHALKYE
jgi:hypothetical protein